MRRAYALIVLILVPLSLPAVPAASIYSEDWETGLDGWTRIGGNGIGVTCGMGVSGCSLRSVRDSGTSHAVERSLNVPIPADSTLVAELRFYNELTANSMSPSFEVMLDEGYARLSLNRNEQETFLLETPTGTSVFGHYGRFEWYHVQILLRGTTVMARFGGGSWDGGPADSAQLEVPGATRVTGIRIANEFSAPRRETPYYFDNIALFDTAACFPFSPTLGSARTVAEWPFDPGFSLGVSGGHASCATSWSFNAGDGSAPVGGAGTPPATLDHTYAAAGVYPAALSVTIAGETRTVTRVITARDCDPLTASLSAPATEGEAPFHAVVSTTTGSTLARCGIEWSIDFGDGTPLVTGSGAAPVDVSHVYTEPGVFTAVFTATRGASTATATRIFAAGPYEESLEGVFTLGGVTGPLDGPSSAALKQADGTDTLTVTWTSATTAHLNVDFLRGGRMLAAQPCRDVGNGVPCLVPRGADTYRVSASLGSVDVEWRAVVRYA